MMYKFIIQSLFDVIERLFVLEFKSNISSGDLLIQSGDSRASLFHIVLIFGIKVDFEKFRSIQSASVALSSDKSGSQKVFQGGVKHTGQGLRTGTFLLVLGCLELSLDFSLDHEIDLLIQLFLQFHSHEFDDTVEDFMANIRDGDQ